MMYMAYVVFDVLPMRTCGCDMDTRAAGETPRARASGAEKEAASDVALGGEVASGSARDTRSPAVTVKSYGTCVG